MKMKFLFYQLFLCLLLLIHYSQCRRSSYSSEEDGNNEVYQKLYKASYQAALSTLPPTCSQILFNQNNIQSQYISSGGLTGRAIPAGTFTSQLLALEYLYGTFCPIPNFPPKPHAFQSVEIVKIAYDKNYLIAHAELIYNITGNIRLTFFVIAAFDKDYKLCGYDGQIRNNGLTLDPHTIQEQQQGIALVCTIAQQFCTGSLQQYTSVNDCINFLTNNVPFGSFDQADQGNVACRLIHTNFVPLSPSVHCPHVGPTGGGACTDKTIDFYYNQPDFLACAYKYKK